MPRSRHVPGDLAMWLFILAELAVFDVAVVPYALAALEKDPEIKAACDAYTDGVNAYIATLDESTYPLEFKLLDYKPEPWTNLRTQLLSKYMAFDLAGFEEDFERTLLLEPELMTEADKEEYIKYMESEQGWAIPLERHKDGKRVFYRYADKKFSIKKQIINKI